MQTFLRWLAKRIASALSDSPIAGFATNALLLIAGGEENESCYFKSSKTIFEEVSVSCVLRIYYTKFVQIK